MLTNKKLIELKIKKIHQYYDYTKDWALTDEEFTGLMAVLNNRFSNDHHDEDGLDDIIDHSLRIDSKTGRVFYSGHQISDKSGVYYYRAEQDAIDKIKSLTGKVVADFHTATEIWDEFGIPYKGGTSIYCCRHTCTL